MPPVLAGATLPSAATIPLSVLYSPETPRLGKTDGLVLGGTRPCSARKDTQSLATP